MAKLDLKSRTGKPGVRASGRMKPADKAAKARARMAGRARRARFFKENKKRLTYGGLAFALLIFVAFFSPLGPDWYYGKLQQGKWASQTTLGTGYFAGLYKLAKFYEYTFRSGKAQECYNEIGQLYYGFSFSSYGSNPPAAMEKRFESERAKAKGLSNGPPYNVSTDDLQYIGYAIRGVAEHFAADNRRGFGRNLVEDLFLNDFCEEHPSACPAEFTEEMRNYGRFLAGR